MTFPLSGTCISALQFVQYVSCTPISRHNARNDDRHAPYPTPPFTSIIMPKLRVLRLAVAGYTLVGSLLNSSYAFALPDRLHPPQPRQFRRTSRPSRYRSHYRG
ncbi:uncharacterized protein SCHCODRAFT_01247316 [Schizophyllum commune H4-8]|uniref:uncharacterized protein n=1 Tax=Schizophyllum commune (strain H4-8 / FGSC 9210) TaxID=578458 RepID=UPI00215FC221|nr:uncharacterized protein SCHCODRAFT_01247316 [Schizophyllum commune H4-8]KAI5885787.1 hypothetical protein SCHCODRAFT_01247316 [Schizophyllum commune H4-8]